METHIKCSLLLIISWLLCCTFATQTSFYSSKTPYTPPISSLNLPTPPLGYELVCAQIVARHGCRALEKRKYDHLIKALWLQAKENEALTKFGEKFGVDLTEFVAINDRIGRGALSGLGRIEHIELAQRLVERLAPLFDEAVDNKFSKRIRVVGSGKPRTKESLEAFVDGLPSFTSSLIDYELPNPSLLYFHEDSKHQAFVKKDKRLKEKIHSIQMQPYSRNIARHLLERLFEKSFVNKLSNGDYFFIDFESGKSIRNEVDAARMLHGLYLIAPGLREEGVGKLLEKYFNSTEAEWFAYLHDAKDYYEKGPSFTGQTVSYQMAQVLLNDLHVHARQCSSPDGDHFLRARFTHAEAIIPLAALMKIPILSDKSTPINDTYTYLNNNWRGEFVAPMSGNIQWDVFRYSSKHPIRQHETKPILVRMLYNEYPVPFKLSCRPYDSANPFFYALDELKRCYDVVDQ